MNEVDKLKIEMDLLLSFNTEQAWTGSLEDLQQRTYVRYADIISEITKRRKILEDGYNIKYR